MDVIVTAVEILVVLCVAVFVGFTALMLMGAVIAWFEHGDF